MAGNGPGVVAVGRMIAPADEVHDFQRVAIRQRDFAELRARGDFAIMLDRDLFRRKSEIAHKRGDGGGGGGAALAVQLDRQGVAHLAERHKPQRVLRKPPCR